MSYGGFQLLIAGKEISFMNKTTVFTDGLEFIKHACLKQICYLFQMQGCDEDSFLWLDGQKPFLLKTTESIANRSSCQFQFGDQSFLINHGTRPILTVDNLVLDGGIGLHSKIHIVCHTDVSSLASIVYNKNVAVKKNRNNL